MAANAEAFYPDRLTSPNRQSPKRCTRLYSFVIGQEKRFSTRQIHSISIKTCWSIVTAETKRRSQYNMITWCE
jgi:hypothetical protein